MASEKYFKEEDREVRKDEDFKEVYEKIGVTPSLDSERDAETVTTKVMNAVSRLDAKRIQFNEDLKEKQGRLSSVNAFLFGGLSDDGAKEIADNVSKKLNVVAKNASDKISKIPYNPFGKYKFQRDSYDEAKAEIIDNITISLSVYAEKKLSDAGKMSLYGKKRGLREIE